MISYKISLEDNNLLRIGFGEPAQNDQIVRDAGKILDSMIENNILKGGQILKINGPASLPVAIVIAHAVAHLFEAIGVFDPKLNKYVIALSHGTKYKPGDLID
ncbi:CRISPR-associated protein Csx3 [Candidatus Desantisbacteria bacterium]|nr:CRISPR-associated protein Csx3 [Candidatus Desantisbacteria bacterium]